MKYNLPFRYWVTILNILYFPLAILYFFCPFYILKALPVWILVTANLILWNEQSKPIACGLFLGSIGDILLEMNDAYGVDLFTPGLISFLLGHLCYIYAFYLPFQKMALLIGIPVHIGYYSVLMYLLLPSVDIVLGVAIAIYAAVLSTMAFSAFNRWFYNDISLVSRIFVVTGAYIFVSSDSLLSLSTFHGKIPNSGLWIMITYYVAQFCISFSSISQYYLKEPSNLSQSEAEGTISKSLIKDSWD